MTKTRDKLLEAKYFLQRMREGQSEPDAFKYNLSAFLTAARSVTMFMQKEFHKIPGFKEYYAKKRCEMKQDETMNLMNSKRVMTIHNQPVHPRANIGVNISETVTISESLSVVLTREDGTTERSEPEPTPPPPPSGTKVTAKWLWYFDELPDKDIISVCEEHIDKLGTLVAECESHFS